MAKRSTWLLMLGAVVLSVACGALPTDVGGGEEETATSAQELSNSQTPPGRPSPCAGECNLSRTDCIAACPEGTNACTISCEDSARTCNLLCGRGGR